MKIFRNLLIIILLATTGVQAMQKPESQTTQAADAQESQKKYCQWMIDGQLCDQSFSDEPVFVDHLKKHAKQAQKETQDDGDSKFCCKWQGCNSKTLRLLGLIKHMVSHKNAQKYWICRLCNKEFSRLNKLTRHMPACNKPFVCKYYGCLYRAAQQSGLDEHAQIHAGPKLFSCNKCSRTFSHNSHLARHYRSEHDDEGLFTCEYPGCTRSFDYEGPLATHVEKEHKVKKLLPCNRPECTFKTTAMYKLVEHYQSVHATICQYCDKLFDSEAEYKKHIDENHLFDHFGLQ